MAQWGGQAWSVQPPSERRFYQAEFFIVYPPFLVVCAVVAWSTLLGPEASASWRPAGILAIVFGAVLTWSALRQHFVAVVTTDGLLTFKAFTRKTRTSVHEISRIDVRTSGPRGGSTWFFRFRGSGAALGGTGGRALARYLVELDPTLSHPEGWLWTGKPWG